MWVEYCERSTNGCMKLLGLEEFILYKARLGIENFECDCSIRVVDYCARVSWSDLYSYKSMQAMYV